LKAGINVCKFCVRGLREHVIQHTESWRIANTMWGFNVTVKRQVQANTWRFKMNASLPLDCEVITYPMDGIRGLGCAPEQRERHMGHVTAAQRGSLTLAWHAPVTFLVPQSARAPAWIADNSDRIFWRAPPLQGGC
jgi:tRNA A37 threonylcarbamoyladenosine synthetase subunit TsaC/SUA5/YrdC